MTRSPIVSPGGKPFHRARPVRALRVLSLLCGMLVPGEAAAQSTAPGAATAQQQDTRMWMTVGDRRFAMTLADTEAARAFAALLPLALDMPDLNANEKHADLTQALPANPSRPGTIRNGDLMLYGSRTLVLFYLTFESPYAYTRLGRVDDPAGLAQALGRRSARIGFSKS